MRRTLFVLAIVFFCSWSIMGHAQDLKLGYVNLKEILDKYEKVGDGEEQLLKDAEEKNAEREKLLEETKNLREKVDLLEDKQREKKERELAEKIKKLQDFTYDARTDLRQKRDEKLREIMSEIKDVMEEYGQSRNYQIIIDDTLLLYKAEGLDVTEDIIKILNKRYKK